MLHAPLPGCALVLSDIPTFRELWDGAALFAAPDDAGAFAALCEELLEDPFQAERLGRAAQRRAAGYSLQAMTTGVLEVYRLLRPDLFRAQRVEAAE